MITLSDFYVRVIRIAYQPRIQIKPDQAINDQAEKTEDECVARCGEKSAGFTDAAQVCDCNETDEKQTEKYSVIVQTLKAGSQGGRCDRFDSGRHRHGHRQNVIDQQRGARNQARYRSEIILGNNKTSTASRIGANF